VDLLLEAFGLSNIADTYIGGLGVRGCSGGQRRRVTLARGVGAFASIIFADEPTSGLSATDAELCVRSLRIVAKRLGILILVVIHQPRREVAELFDQLLILTASPGRAVYNGPMVQAMPYFQAIGFELAPQANPTDFYLDLATPGAPTDQVAALVTAFETQQRTNINAIVAHAMDEKGESARDMLEAFRIKMVAANLPTERRENTVYASGISLQFRFLLKRKVRITVRSPVAIGMPIAVPVALAVLIGLMFRGIGQKAFAQQLPFIFLQLTNLALAGMQLLPSAVQERTYMKYDNMEAMYSEFAWSVTQFIVEVPLCLTGAMLNVLIMYALADMDWQFFPTIFGWCLLLFLVFNSLFAFIAACAKDARMAQIFAIPFQMIFMMFSGFMVTRNAAPPFLQWIFVVSPNGYAMESIVVRMAPVYGIAGQAVVESYGFEDGRQCQGILVMIAMVLGFRIAELLSLRFLNNIQK